MVTDLVGAMLASFVLGFATLVIVGWVFFTFDALILDGLFTGKLRVAMWRWFS